MNAIIIAIGDEILIGQVVDTNSTFISKKLYSLGVQTLKSISIKDEPSEIVGTLNQAFEEVDLVIFTGGLGPTNDDLTKHTLTDFFGDTLEFNQKIMTHIDELFKKLGRKTAELNREQAMLPKSATLLHNEFGTAAGMIFEKNNKIAISLPGVPFEMKNLMETGVVPFIKNRYKTGYLVHKTVLTYGLPESELAEKISSWESNLPDTMKLAYLPSPGRVRLRLSIQGENESQLYSELATEIDKLKEILGDLIFGYDDEPIENIVAKLLVDNFKTVCTAESFTGGKIASMLTSIPGSSKYYMGSVVSYSAQSKIDILGVDKKIIENKTVVSREVAQQMAEHARDMFDTDFAISTTGVAGPDKGEDGKEIGTAYIALATRNKTLIQKYNFGQPREKMQGRAVAMAFDMLRKEML